MKKLLIYRLTDRFYMTLLLVSILFTPQAWADLQQDMLALEQRYIPALLLSSQADSRASLATAQLVQQWYVFKQIHAYRHQDDLLWDFDMVAIERDLLDTQRVLQSEQYPSAVERLMSVRERISQLRARHHIRFYIDDVTRFDSSMQALLQRLRMGMAADSYTQIVEAHAVWRQTMQLDVNLYDYGLNHQQVEYLRRCQKNGEQLLSAMEENFLHAQYDKLLQQGVQMQHLYTETYAIFGRY